MQIVSFEASTMLGTRPDRPETSQRSLTFFGVPSHFGQAGVVVTGILTFQASNDAGDSADGIPAHENRLRAVLPRLKNARHASKIRWEGVKATAAEYRPRRKSSRAS
jgi:hypothetical protein